MSDDRPAGERPAPAPEPGALRPADDSLPRSAPTDEAAAPEAGEPEGRAVPAGVISEEEFRRRTRRAFLVGGTAALAGALGWRWLRTAERAAGLPWPVREGLELNRELWQGLHREGALAPTFPRSEARVPRFNGQIGIEAPLDAASWRLRVEGPDRGLIGELSLDDLRRLPRHEQVTELKCVEGWSVVVHWAGARFADFAAAFAQAVPERAFRFASLRTPDDRYYVALDRASAMHPQTLLCYELHGAPLTPEHGAPLRLVVPLSYGVKHIKRVGTVRFATERPNDYWAARGYDWYLGH